MAGWPYPMGLEMQANLDLLARVEPVRFVGAVGQPAFAGTWVNLDNSAATPGTASQRSAGFYKDRGRVFLTGAIKGGTVNTAAFTLPERYRPKAAWVFEVTSNDLRGELIVSAAGVVTPGVGSTVNFFLEGVSFRVA